MEQGRFDLRTAVVIVVGVSCILLGIFIYSGRPEAAPIVFEGIPIIHNARECTPSNPCIEFKKEWEICPSAQDGDSAEQIQAMDVDTNGNVYVLGKSSGIRVYSKDGKCLRAIEGPGGGSDKLNNPAAISLTESNSLIVGESMPSQLIFFDSRGKYIGDSSLKDVKVIIRLQAMSAKRLLIEKADVKATIAGITTIRDLSIADSSGENCTNIFSTKTRRSLTSSTVSEKTMGGFVWCADSKGNIYVVEDAYEYRINVLDLNGKIIRIIEKEFVPVRRAQQELQELESEMSKTRLQFGLSTKVELSETKRIIAGIFSDDKERLWVVTPEGSPESGFALHVFDKEGRFISKAAIIDAMGNDNFLMGKGYFYFTSQKRGQSARLYKYAVHERR